MYTSKKEADAHDKMLDIAENLFSFIEKADRIDLNESQLEELSIYLANHRETVIQILRGSPVPEPGSKAVRDEAADIVSSPDRNHPQKGRKKKQTVPGA